ncbi:MAG: 5'-methylthioadenosine/S-adenosylhomocysteine nucleosidase [Clostridiales bacterium]|nr:5'-methylthioadenosine/S-adenosylhomocysteine nucleosidase [Clostridiales bacterium]
MRKIGILCASGDELAPFLSHMKDRRVSEKVMLQIHGGTIGGWETAVLFSGVCKVNAAIAAQTLIDAYQADRHQRQRNGYVPQL